MPKKDTIIEINSNFHHLAGKDLLCKKDDSFKEYRKKWQEWPKKFYVGEFPLFIDIEITNACNLKCPFCPTTPERGSLKKGLMSLDIVKKIIDEGADNGLYGVKFNIRGEPLLHPELHEFVQYAKKKGLVDVYFNTNAMLLTEEVSKRLIDAGLDRISVSFEGYTKDVYERHRVGSNYDTVLANITKLRALKKKIGVTHPRIRVQTVMLPGLEPFFDGYRKFWAERVDEVGFIDHQEEKFQRRMQYSWACPQIWQRLGVWWDGTILPCNHDFGTQLFLGKIQDISIKGVWHSDKLNKIRNIHKKGMAHEIPACETCHIRNTEIFKITRGNKA
jgi:radical SAM protein with 4Fe4S-binding SPASM domain